MPGVRALSRPQSEHVVRPAYLDLQRRDDMVEGHARRRYCKGHYFRGLTDEVIERGARDRVGPDAPGVSLQAHGGAIADVPEADAAFSHRDTRSSSARAAGPTPPRTTAHRAAGGTPRARAVRLRRLRQLLGDEVAGVGAPLGREAGPADPVKETYDPGNVFHLNHNIRPSGVTADG